jgi:phosphoglycerate dehydrogenase-like enzyme
MRPKLLLVDEPCEKAKEMLAEVFEFVKPNESEYTTDFTAVYTQLTPVVSNATVFCPCTGIDHIRASDVVYLDDKWKQGEGRNVTSTAEHTWSLVLQMAKMKRMQLSGKTIGIIGSGRIGKQVAKYAKAFGMGILVYDIKYPPNDYKGLLTDSDIITLHVPLNETTKGMIGKKEFNIMKHGVLLINTSRQEIVNIEELQIKISTSILQARYNTGIIYYADDFKDNVDLYGYSNVIQTDHIGGNCTEAREATDIYIANKAIQWWEERGL